VSKNNNKPLLRAKKYSSLKMSIWVSKNPEFYAVFRYEEIIQKKMYRKKLDPNKHFFWGHRQFFLEKQFSGIIFCRFFF
jgi:hypothetical protein